MPFVGTSIDYDTIARQVVRDDELGAMLTSIADALRQHGRALDLDIGPKDVDEEALPWIELIADQLFNGGKRRLELADAIDHRLREPTSKKRRK